MTECQEFVSFFLPFFSFFFHSRDTCMNIYIYIYIYIYIGRGGLVSGIIGD